MNEQRTNPLVGVWALESYVSTPLEGGREYWPLGQSPLGQIIYTAGGYMSAQLAARDRADGDTGLYLAYGGPYRIDLDEGLVAHEVSVAIDGAYVGREQLRRFALSNDRLILTTAEPVVIWGRTEVSRLDWKRISM